MHKARAFFRRRAADGLSACVGYKCLGSVSAEVSLATPHCLPLRANPTAPGGRLLDDAPTLWRTP
jgi:hypothetical protein